MIAAHHRNLENKLKPLEEADRKIILRDFDQAMPSYTNDNLANNDFINQVSATIIAGYAKTKAESQARKLNPKAHAQQIQQFAEEQEMIVIAKLQNNESLSGVLDKNLVAAAQSRFGTQQKQAQQQQPSYWSMPVPVPVQPAPSAPAVHSYSSTGTNNHKYSHSVYRVSSDKDKKRIAEGEKELEQITAMLRTTQMSNRTITRFCKYFLESIQENNEVPVIPPLAHTQNALVTLFNKELKHAKKKLSYEIRPSSTLDRAVEATRATEIPKITRFTAQTAADFQAVIHLLEDTILKNADDIECPICTETYKQNDTFGSVEKITLKSSSSGDTCHSICKGCAKQQPLNNCPLCRRNIDQQDLRQKISQPDSPANWRP